MKRLSLFFKLDITRHSPSNDQESQRPRASPTPRPPPNTRKASNNSSRSRQDQSRPRTTSSPQVNPQSRQETPVRPRYPSRPTVNPGFAHQRTRSLDERTFRRRNPRPPPKAQAQTIPLSPYEPRRRGSVGSLPTIDSYVSSPFEL
jgi:hypothetical protein